VLIFDERHQIHVVLSSDDENALAAVTIKNWPEIVNFRPVP
jgi:hypothetical protein